MRRAIRINGTTRQVLNSLSSGPGQEPHTYQIAGAWVERVGNQWKMQRRGQFAVVVTVEVGGDL